MNPRVCLINSIEVTRCRRFNLINKAWEGNVVVELRNYDLSSSEVEAGQLHAGISRIAAQIVEHFTCPQFLLSEVAMLAVGCARWAVNTIDFTLAQSQWELKQNMSTRWGIETHHVNREKLQKKFHLTHWLSIATHKWSIFPMFIYYLCVLRLLFFAFCNL